MLRAARPLSIVVVCLPSVSPWARKGDRDALIELYQATGGSGWATNFEFVGDDPYWNQTYVGGNWFWNVDDPSFAADPCQEKLTPEGMIPDWFGVNCDDPCYYPIDGDDCRFGRITSIHLPHNGLTGTIPPSLFDNLVNLSVVDFSHNDISGTIPTEVGKLRNIHLFLLGNNKLSGTIPTEIYTMGTRVQRATSCLFQCPNSLCARSPAGSGTPVSLSNLTSTCRHVGSDEAACALEDLVWPDGTPYTPPNGGYNITVEEAMAFNGSCPTHMVNTMGLSHFDVSANKITGMLPTTFGDLVNLQAIDVSRNADLGMEGYQKPNDDFHEQFYVYTSMIPTEMGALKKLQVIKMDNSRFMRHMPTEIGNMRSLRYWDVRGTTTPGEPETNAVSGTIPTQFGRLKSLMTFNMENNTVSGTIPPDLHNLTSLMRFVIPDNKLSGSIPDIFGGPLSNTLDTWDTFNNKLTGDIPSSIGELMRMEYLYVQNEQTDPIRNYWCKHRIADSANGKKANWAMMSHDYISFSMAGTCVNPLDVAGAFNQLSGDV